MKKIVRRNIEEADAASNGVESDKYQPYEDGTGIDSSFFQNVGLDLWEHADKQISDLKENPECIRDVLSAIAFVNTNATDIGTAVYLGVYGDI